MEKTAQPMQPTSQFISITHCRFGSNHGAAAATQQYTTVPHNQAIESTPIFVKIACKVTKIHPIKRKPSPTPPKIHLDHTLPFWKQSRRRSHPPTTPNDPSPSGYCQHSNSCGNSLRTCKDTPNQARAFPHTSQNSPQLNIALLEAITALPPSTNNAKQFFISRLLPALQF